MVEIAPLAAVSPGRVVGVNSLAARQKKVEITCKKRLKFKHKSTERGCKTRVVGVPVETAASGAISTIPSGP